MRVLILLCVWNVFECNPAENRASSRLCAHCSAQEKLPAVQSHAVFIDRSRSHVKAEKFESTDLEVSLLFTFFLPDRPILWCLITTRFSSDQINLAFCFGEHWALKAAGLLYVPPAAYRCPLQLLSWCSCLYSLTQHLHLSLSAFEACVCWAQANMNILFRLYPLLWFLFVHFSLYYSTSCS